MYVQTMNYPPFGTPGPCSGMGCSGMGGLTMDGSGLFGTGLFSGDVSTWGIPEAIAGGVGLLAVVSLFGSTKRAARRTRSLYRGAMKGAKAAA